MGDVGFFRNRRRQRVIQLEEDLSFGLKKTMRERWDFLTLVEFYQHLDELDSLIQKNKIIEEDALESSLQGIQKIKKNYPFDEKLDFPNWDFNHFIGEILLLAGNLKKVMLLSRDNMPELPSYNSSARVWKILEGFFTAAQKRRDNIEEEEKRITTFILIASEKHVYYMQLVLSILSIIIGLVIGWIFYK